MSDGNDLALKYTTDDPDAAQQGTSRLAAREAAVLVLLDPKHLYASGTTEAGSWLAVTWHAGESLNKPWGRVRRENAALTRSAALVATTKAAVAVAELHDDGWRHADLQADHILVPADGPARLVDLALAQGPLPNLADHEVIYRGALTHLTAPEVAVEVLATPATHHVQLTAAAEVYMFAAVIFAGWSGNWPHEYGPDAINLTVPQILDTISHPRTLRPMPTGWPEMAGLLRTMLSSKPADRPTMTEVVRSLRAAVGGQP
jgi:hypothetical protein